MSSSRFVCHSLLVCFRVSCLMFALVFGQFCGSDGFGLGSGTAGSYGLWLSADLSHGSSAPSSTFGSPCLVDGGDEHQRFDIAGVEIWGFDCGDTLERNAGAGVIQVAWRGEDR